jgi:5-methylcytosine-specific restriction enzyme A
LATFILTWNPTKWSWEDNGYAEDIAASEAGRIVSGRWSVGVRRSGIAPGDRGFVLRQHDHRGIVASGTFRSPIYEDDHWDGSGRPQAHADFDFDTILTPEDCLPVDELKLGVQSVAWDRLQGSGVQVASSSVDLLERFWQDHLGSFGWRSPEEESAPTFLEGNLARVEVNRYERDPRARRACVERWGHNCSVCAMDFARIYGKLGEGFIHIHHLRSLATLGKDRKVDPVKDLRPVCPNCHAMLHRRSPILSISELRRRMASSASKSPKR